MTRWLLEQQADDRFDVLRNGRRVKSDLTWDQASKYVGTHKAAGDRAQIEEPDGYRRPARIR